MTTTIARSLCAPIGHCSVMSVEPRCCHQNGLLNTSFQGTEMAQSRGICPPDEMCQQTLLATFHLGRLIFQDDRMMTYSRMPRSRL